MRETCFLADIAKALNMRTRTIYREGRWKQMIEQDGMPPPVSKIGRPRFDVLAINAWLGRNHPHAPKIGRAANDTAPPSAPQTVTEHQDYLRRVYGRQSA